MRVVIFGGSKITDRTLLDRAMENAASSKGIVPTAVACGKAPGADTMGEDWANERKIPVEPFPANWNDISVPGAVVRFRHGKPYNARAGHDRNVEMGAWAEAGVCVWDGCSPGTKDMISILRNQGKPVHVEMVGQPQPGLFDGLD